jgi:hypothetical protein
MFSNLMNYKTLGIIMLHFAMGSTLLPAFGDPAPKTGYPVRDSVKEIVGEATASISVLSPETFVNVHTDTMDGVLFSTATDKKRYRPGDTLYVHYRIKNHSMGTVLYDFATSCQFDLHVTGSNGKFFYSLLGSKPCEPGASRLTLAPSAEQVTDFSGIPLKPAGSDTLTVKAQMAGYPLSTVSVKVAYLAAPAPVTAIALEGTTERDKPALEFNSETKTLVIKVSRAQRLTISAFILTGKKVNKLSCEKFLAPGTHLISFNNRKLADGVVIFKVEGVGFSETKTINLSR